MTENWNVFRFIITDFVRVFFLIFDIVFKMSHALNCICLKNWNDADFFLRYLYIWPFAYIKHNQIIKTMVRNCVLRVKNSPSCGFSKEPNIQ